MLRVASTISKLLADIAKQVIEAIQEQESQPEDIIWASG